MIWKHHNVDDCDDLKFIIKLLSIFKWYKTSLEKEDEHFVETFKYYSKIS